jgi:ribosomal-protein-alanine N-acetyltransferase
LPEMAVEWLEKLPALHEAGTHRVWAITLDFTTLVGAIGLHDIDREHSNAELGYWIGKDFWGHGYATEAARAIVQYALDDMTLERVYAKHFARNPQSGRVLEKIGMQREGVMRRHFRKWGEFQDCVVYGILRDSE